MRQRTARRSERRSSRRGGALVIVLMALTGLAALSAALLSITTSADREVRGARADLTAFYAAEAALSQATFELSNGGTGNLGQAGQMLEFGGARFYVKREDSGGLVSLVATAVAGGERARVEALLDRSESNQYAYGAFGDEGLTMDSNAMIDSYDSGSGAYTDQDVNGSGSSRYANSNGHAGSNADIHIRQNTDIHGDAHPGPSGSTTIVGNAAVSGSTAPSPTLLDMPPLVLPTLSSSGSFSVGTGGSQSLVSGDHAFDDLALSSNSTLTVQGPARIVCDNFDLASGSSVVIDSAGGPVEFYVRNDFTMNSNTLIASSTFIPADFALFLESDNVIDPDVDVEVDGNPDEVDFDSNAKLFGTIYAPNASIDIDSNFELFGSLIARRVHLDSNSKIHFDEALLDAAATSSDSGYVWVCWREVSEHGD